MGAFFDIFDLLDFIFGVFRGIGRALCSIRLIVSAGARDALRAKWESANGWRRAGIATELILAVATYSALLILVVWECALGGA